MCGISGFFLRPGEQADRDRLERMAQAMRRRGPDAQGVFARGPVGLAHRRLKVIDLSPAADQPLFNENGTVAVVFNGEIYNFGELRGELERRGHAFKSRSDTEVIVHGFEEWGSGAFARFNGIFAFALWDGRGAKERVYLVRDRFGAKPLFYSLEGGRLAFASELKPLLELDWISRDIDPQDLFRFLKFSHVPTPRSILAGVRQLEPAHWLAFDHEGVTGGSYWEIGSFSRAGEAEAPRRSEAEWVEELEQVLARVVGRQSVSDVPLGCFLSGGIDSSLLAAVHARACGGRIEAFTIGYRESEFDELPQAREVARALGASHHELMAEPRDFFALVAEVPELFDQPFADPTLLSSLLLSRFARERVTVAFSGDGGDELFFGYPYQRALLALGPLARVPRGARDGAFGALAGPAARLVAGLSPGRVSLAAARAGKLAEILRFRDEAELLQYFVGSIGPLPMARLAGLLQERAALDPPLFDELLHRIGDIPWREKIEQVFLRSFLVDTVLAKTDRAGMACGLEARVPFLDDEMVAFASRVPFGLKYRPFTSKYLLRKLAEKILPPGIATRKKQGFSIPLRDWLRGELRYLLDEYLNEPRLKREGVFVPAEVRALVREHLRGRANHSHLLWSLVSFQLWKERYLG